ncbi:MAG TPA: hypothetical protein PKC18_18825 [Lacipirellulaceae bacterium]|nr:hypothetical protein [Lacipirellulaceae bacterium]HMP08238.1 hypothetical protein [Lacipirellulaceae bacterium]
MQLPAMIPDGITLFAVQEDGSTYKLYAEVEGPAGSDRIVFQLSGSATVIGGDALQEMDARLARIDETGKR